MKNVTRRAASFIAAFLVSGMAFAQADKPIRFVLPVAAGSGVDAIARTAAPALAKALGAPIVIENVAGAGGVLGTAALVKSPPDGSTLSMLSNNHVINPAVYKSLPYDPIADVTPIALVGTAPMVIAVHPQVPAKGVAELVALMKSRPDQLNYGSSGNGTILHLAAAMLLEQAGVRAKHIPYRGVGPMIGDLLGGQVDWVVTSLATVQQHVKSRTLRVLGVAAPARLAAAPDIPTVAEQGLKDYLVEGWFAVAGPAKMPPAEVRRINAAVAAAFSSPEVVEAMALQGNTIKVGTPEEAALYFRSELRKYAAIVKAIGLERQ